MSNYKIDNPSVSFIQLLTLAFIILKLTHVIDWSWWWVLAPLWIPTVIVMITVLLGLIVGGTIKVVRRMNNK